ncbi:hypothetical protein [Algivirga pacifica]|uniref:Uncharacterized protein n=1 Tax=Algivirga pacifica TaxID=1162670 RepID=A0ABP9DK57_9BACT
MMKRILLLMGALLCTLGLSAQQETVIGTKDGIKVSYQLLLKDEGKKKDKYILIVNAVNETDQDLYYAVPLIPDAEGNLAMPFSDEEQGFSKVRVRNSTSIFGAGRSVVGEQTELYTTNNELLFLVKKGGHYTNETTFKVEAGNKPLLTNTFTNIVKPLGAYDIKISPAVVNGDYVASCGDVRLNLSFQTTEEDGEHLVATVNGQQFIWLKSTETSFVRKDSNEFTLTYDSHTQSFHYATSDGMLCTWGKMDKVN